MIKLSLPTMPFFLPRIPFIYVISFSNMAPEASELRIVFFDIYEMLF